MKSVVTLHRLQRRIKKRPGSIIREFEEELTEELGIVEGQAWTVKEWLRRQSFGKFRGLQRCCYMDVAVYELLRSGHREAAAAQVVQNLKSKLQCIIQGGDWSAAWLLTGLADPLSKKEFAGSKTEMAVVSQYLGSMAKLKKKVKESTQGSVDED